MFYVALHVRAWVEIYGRTFEDAGEGRPPCEGVGRNYMEHPKRAALFRRPPCEGVGRNLDGRGNAVVYPVALHVRAWVEIAGGGAPRPLPAQVALHVRAWVEIREVIARAFSLQSPSM